MGKRVGLFTAKGVFGNTILASCSVKYSDTWSVSPSKMLGGGGGWGGTDDCKGTLSYSLSLSHTSACGRTNTHTHTLDVWDTRYCMATDSYSPLLSNFLFEPFLVRFIVEGCQECSAVPASAQRGVRTLPTPNTDPRS